VKSEKNLTMNILFSIIQDTRRIKNNGKYPLKLRLYYKDTVLYPLIYELSKTEFEKLDAKRVTEHLSEIRYNLKLITDKAKEIANQITPFDFEKFYDRFVFKNKFFVQRKKTEIKQPFVESSSDEIPDEWKKKFPLLKEKPAGPSYCSTIFYDIIKSLLFQNRIGTARSYHTSYNSLKLFRGNMRISEMTAQYLKEYESWMINTKGNSKTTVGFNTRCFRAVFNEAIELKLIGRESYPFGKRRYKIPSGKNIKKALYNDSISKLYSTPAETNNQQRAKDFWFFSFYGNGMNVKDIIYLKYKNIKGEFLVFERAKTENTTQSEPVIISTFINDDMKRIMNKWGNEDKSPSNYIFPILISGITAIRQDELKRNFISFINNNMAKISEKAGIGKIVKTMEARHSASTIMKNAGVSPHYIKESLGHTSLKTTENYLAGFENDQRKEFAKVLEEFKVVNQV
jgi:integrase/recombinase XerD